MIQSVSAPLSLDFTTIPTLSKIQASTVTAIIQMALSQPQIEAKTFSASNNSAPDNEILKDEFWEKLKNLSALGRMNVLANVLLRKNGAEVFVEALTYLKSLDKAIRGPLIKWSDKFKQSEVQSNYPLPFLLELLSSLFCKLSRKDAETVCYNKEEFPDYFTLDIEKLVQQLPMILPASLLTDTVFLKKALAGNPKSLFTILSMYPEKELPNPPTELLEELDPTVRKLSVFLPMSQKDIWCVALDPGSNSLAEFYQNLTPAQKSHFLLGLQRNPKWQDILFPIALECDSEDLETIYKSITTDQLKVLVTWQLEGIKDYFLRVPFSGFEETTQDDIFKSKQRHVYTEYTPAYQRTVDFFSKLRHLRCPVVSEYVGRYLAESNTFVYFLCFFTQSCSYSPLFEYKDSFFSYLFLELGDPQIQRALEWMYADIDKEESDTRTVANRGLNLARQLFLYGNGISKKVVDFLESQKDIKVISNIVVHLMKTLYVMDKEELCRRINENLIHYLSEETRLELFKNSEAASES